MGQAVIFCCTNAAGTCIILFKGGDIVKIMYISNGSLGMYDGSSARPVASQRVEQLARTLRQLEQQHAWKTEGEGAKFMHQHNPYANAAEQMRGKVTAVAPHHEGIIYAVDLGRTGGMYTKNPFDPDEPEGLVTSAVGFYARDMVRHGDSIYASIREGAESHIVRIDPENGRYESLTEGDTLERHPFIREDGLEIYFDMCGYARDDENRIIARGPSGIACMDISSGEIRELYSDPDTEFLKYSHIGGVQRMLVRPYKAKHAENPLGCLLAPFYAVVGFVHFFSSINAARKGKSAPLAAGKSEAARYPDEKITIDGIRIDPKIIAREQQKHKDEYPGLLPRDWQLVAIQPDGSLQTLQHGVLDYLPLDDGGYIYSNGAHVFQVNAAGERKLLFKERLVSDMLLL